MVRPVPIARFADRVAAGAELARHLAHHADSPDLLVLGLPRGGVPVAAEVARALRAPLDAFTVRKIGLPGRIELAIGALASGGVTVLNDRLIAAAGIAPGELDGLIQRAGQQLRERELRFRGERPAVAVADRLIVLVDDGLATGATMAAAVEALRRGGAVGIVVGVPVGAAESCRRLGRLVDELVCVAMPEPFMAVGAWYEDFSPSPDAEVRRLLGVTDR